MERQIASVIKENMASNPTRFRFVKCPTCRQVLPEFADVPVYMCGGCDTVLRAKYQNAMGEKNASGSFKNAQPVHVSEDAESVSSSMNETIPCITDAHVSDSNNEGVGYDLANSDRSLSEVGGHSNGVIVSEEVSLCKQVLSEVGTCGERGGSDALEESDSRSPRLLEHLEGESSKCTDKSRSDKQSRVYLDDALESQSISNHLKSNDKMEEGTESVISEDIGDSRFNGQLENLLKSPTTRSYYSYYGSVSSTGDDYDDNISSNNRKMHLSRRVPFRPHVLGSVGTEEKLAKREDVFVNGKVDPETAELPQITRLASTLSSGRYETASGSFNLDQNEHLQSDNYGFQACEHENLQNKRTSDSIKSRKKSESTGPSGFLLRDTPGGRYSSSVFQNSSQSNHGHRDVERLDERQMELLRDVERLKNQLNSLSIQRGRAKGKFPVSDPAQEVLPGCNTSHFEHLLSACGNRAMGSQQCKSSNLQFSGPAICHHHVDYSCLQCCGNNWQYPTQFQHHICYNRGLCQGYPAQMCLNPYQSGPASLERLVDPSRPRCFVHNASAPLYKQTAMDYEMDMVHYKEKRQLLKRHCLPIAGGAPFITCYKCWELLQLPADFILARRRKHRLRCGACSELLTFCLQGRSHVFPSSPTFVQHPPSEVDHEGSDSASASNLPTLSHTDGQLFSDPVSSSDDYKRSFFRYSSEGEPPLVAPQVANFQYTMSDKRNALGSLAETTQDGKETVTEQSGGSTCSTSMGDKSAVMSPKVGKSVKSSPRSASPLHRLMGYASPSEIINGSSSGAGESDNSDIALGKRCNAPSKKRIITENLME